MTIEMSVEKNLPDTTYIRKYCKDTNPRNKQTRYSLTVRIQKSKIEKGVLQQLLIENDIPIDSLQVRSPILGIPKVTFAGQLDPQEVYSLKLYRDACIKDGKFEHCYDDTLNLEILTPSDTIDKDSNNKICGLFKVVSDYVKLYEKMQENNNRN